MISKYIVFSSIDNIGRAFIILNVLQILSAKLNTIYSLII